MCGRFYVDDKNIKIRKWLNQLSGDIIPAKIGEVFPNNIALVLENHNQKIKPTTMRWGLPHWDGKGLIINARSETVLEKSIFRNSNPIAIPATGFFEWKKVTDTKIKYLFTNPDSDIMFLAGFWKNMADKKGDIQQRFAILTTNANSAMKKFHLRMPLLLTQNEISPWLSRDKTLLKKIPYNCKHILCY